MPSLFDRRNYKNGQWLGGLKTNSMYKNLKSFRRPVKNKRPMGLNKTYKKRGLMIWNPKTIGKTGIVVPKLHWSKKGAKRTRQQQLWYRDRAKAQWMRTHGWKWTFGRRPR